MRNWIRNCDKKFLCICLAIVLLLLPFFYTMYYALPSTDDFWMAAGIARENVVSEALHKANLFYMTWEGQWLYIFLEVLLNPLIYAGISGHAIGLELMVFAAIFFIALFVAVKSFFVNVVDIQSKYVYTIGYLLVLICFLNTAVYTEIFYWFVGSCYLWAMIFILFTVSLELKFLAKGVSRVEYVLMCVLGMLGCSFYTEAVFPGMIFLVCVYFTRKNKKVGLSTILPFLLWVLAGLSAVVAPGNFVRYGQTVLGGEISVAGSLLHATMMTFDGIFDLIKNPLIVIIMAILLVFGIRNAEKTIAINNIFVPFLVSIVGLWITYFPFALGYGTASYIPNRCQFVFNLYAVLALSFDFFFLGNWLGQKKQVKLTMVELKKIALGILVFGYICLIPSEYYRNLPYAKTVSSAHQVTLAYSEWKYLLGYIKDFPESEVGFDRLTVNTPIIKSPGITSEKENSINEHVADYFGKDAVWINWQ